jgi:hypothetical protein
MRIGSLLGMTVVLVACAESPVAPLRVLHEGPSLTATTSVETMTLPFSSTVWVSCANNGTGEDVDLSGELEIAIHTTEDGNGGVHVASHVRPSQVIGVGDVTGVTYRGHGGTIMNEQFYPDGLPQSYSFINNFRIIGQGKGNNLQVHMVIHQLWEADGQLSVDTDLDHTECKS